ncbi:efflux RND transporter permease subunit [Chlorobium sp. N1]|uniref:efflux RND transporter permease subunit n=1 Tax=Chlorobium sp. N1 TaxID=2491138 RepID=UPI00103F61D2|nr:efflux RND transporter permease subunit [Chlorobium sp. N1]TCD47329.1 efflux RND transporter permease subunit [Chlorobium sp. N1]
MKGLIRYFVRYPVLGNVIFIAVTLFGLVSFSQIRTTFFPDIPPAFIYVSATYPGASPEEIEEAVTLKIEDELKGVSGIDRVTSASRENSTTITVELMKGADPNELLQEVTNAVNQISSFPAELEDLRVYKQERVDFVISYSLHGDVDLQTLKGYARALERELRNRGAATKIELSGFPEEEIEIGLRENAMRSYGITFEEIASAVGRANVKITGGTIRGEREDLLIRADSKGYYAAELENLVVRSDGSGAVVRLGELADVRDRWAEDPNRRWFNGTPSIIVEVSRSADEDMFRIRQDAEAVARDFDMRHPDVDIDVLWDGSAIVKERADILTWNGLVGMVLVVLFLAFSLNPRLALWVAASIPFSFAGMFMIGNLYGLSINVVSLLGMILVVGILVDDGIVIAESIYQRYEKGEKPLQAAINGTLEVIPSVAAAVLTTVVLFLLFLFLDGDLGQRVKDIAFVAMTTLLISLVEGIFILPAHIAHSKALHAKPEEKSWILRKSEAFLHLQRDVLYAPVLRFAIRNPLVTAVVPVALLVVTFGAMKGGLIKATFFPIIEHSSVDITFEMPAGTPQSTTERLLGEMEAKVWAVDRAYREESGSQDGLLTAVSRSLGPQAHQGGLRVALVDNRLRSISSLEAGNRFRRAIGTIPGATRLIIGGGGFWGMPVSIALKSDNLRQLDLARAMLERELKAMEQLKDVADDSPPGLEEVTVRLNEKAFALGLTTGQVMQQVRSAFFGREAQRLLRGIDEVKVWVRYAEGERSSIGAVESMFIRLDDGRTIPLRQIADLQVERGVATVNHIDAQRVIKIEADIASPKTSVPQLLDLIEATVMPQVLEAYPDVSFNYEGQSRESGKTTGSMRIAFPALLFIMYLIIVVTFRSFSQALLVMLLLPFTLVGVAWGHFIQGYILSILSLFGFIALLGIVVNDSLVFISTFNRRIKEGASVEEAVYQVGLSRFRPIILTSITTIAGLGPLIFEQSRQAQFLSPMAISVAYGLLFGTTLTLIVVPSLLMLFNASRRHLYGFFRKRTFTPEEVEPAWREEIFTREQQP